jgi:hypothetical protein
MRGRSTAFLAFMNKLDLLLRLPVACEVLIDLSWIEKNGKPYVS